MLIKISMTCWCCPVACTEREYDIKYKLTRVANAFIWNTTCQIEQDVPHIMQTYINQVQL